MSEKDNGGPAFPLNSPSGTPDYMPKRDGMSLRDYFAGQALAGLAGNGTDWPERDESDALAKASYLIADALLKARTQGE